MSFLARNLSVRDRDAERQLFKLFLGISVSARSVAVLQQKRFGKLSQSGGTLGNRRALDPCLSV